MARPSLIAEIHGLKYDLRRSRLNPAELPKLLQAYEARLAEACVLFGCQKVELLRAIAPDFAKWIKEEQLPPLEQAQLEQTPQ
jgi:hypothetical protein